MDYRVFDFGALHRWSETVTTGLALRNFLGFAAKDKYDGFSLPQYVALGLAWRHGGVTYALDNEVIRGDFGGFEKKRARFWLVRAGVETNVFKHVAARAGIMIPAVAYTSSLGDIRKDVPDPKIGGSAGFGVAIDRFVFDFALYGNPARSYIDQKIVISSVWTLSMKF